VPGETRDRVEDHHAFNNEGDKHMYGESRSIHEVSFFSIENREYENESLGDHEDIKKLDLNQFQSIFFLL